MPLRHWASALAGMMSPASRLSLLVGRLHDDVVVERLEREAKRARVLQHASTILP